MHTSSVWAMWVNSWMHPSGVQAVFIEQCYLPGTPKLGTALPQQQTLALMFTMPGSLHLAQWVGFCWPLWAKLGCARPQKHLRGVEPTFIMSSVLHLHCICKLTQTLARGEARCYYSLNLASACCVYGQVTPAQAALRTHYVILVAPAL